MKIFYGHIIIVFLIINLATSCKSQTNSFDAVDLSPDNIYFHLFDKQSGWYRTLLNEPHKWGFIDKDSVVRIPFLYDYINPFDSMNLAYGQLNEKYGYINKMNEVVIPFIYEELGYFSPDLAFAKKYGKYGFINVKGETVLPFIYDDAKGFTKYGISSVKQSNKWGFIDTNGSTIIPIIYEDVDDHFDDSIVLVRKNNYYGLFSYTGRQITDFEFSKVHLSVFKNESFNKVFNQNGLVLVEKNGQFAYLDSNLNIAIPYGTYSISNSFNEHGLAIVGNGKRNGIINSKGDFVYPYDIQLIGHPKRYTNESNVFIVEKNKSIGLLGYNANPLTKIDNKSVEWDYVNNSKNRHGYYIIQNSEGLYGIINGIGEIQIPFDYTEIQPFDGDSLTIAKKGNYYGIINYENRIIRDFECQEIFSGKWLDYYVIKVDGKYGMIDAANKTIIPIEYEELDPCYYDRNHRFIAKKDGKRGIITEEQKIVIPFEYDIISNWVEYGPDAHIVIKNGKYGLISREGKVIIPTDYEQMYIDSEFPLIKVGNDGLWGTVNWKNEIVHPIEYEQVLWDWTFLATDTVDTVYVKMNGKYFATDLNGNVVDSNVSEELIEEKFGYLFRDYDDVEVIESNIPKDDFDDIDF